MKQAVVFAGTIEGRLLSEWLASEGVDTLVSVATEYGRQLLEPQTGLEVRQGRLSTEEMQELFEKEGRPLVLDVTHPYASVVSENIHAACEKTGCRYLRLIRPSVSVQEREADRDDLVVMDSVEEAVDWLSGTTGRILTTTGSKELSKFTKLPGYQERVYARVLSTPEVVRQCTELGFTGQHLICMQGPFSRELNLAMLRQIGASYLVTKESGRAGGFPEKLLAAQEAGARLVLIGRPPEQEGLSIEEGVRFLMKYFSLGEPEFLQAGEKSARPQGESCGNWHGDAGNYDEGGGGCLPGSGLYPGLRPYAGYLPGLGKASVRRLRSGKDARFCKGASAVPQDRCGIVRRRGLLQRSQKADGGL